MIVTSIAEVTTLAACGSKLDAPPVAIGELGVYLAGNDGVLYSYNITDGHPLWQYQVSTGIIGAPAIGANETIYVT